MPEDEYKKELGAIVRSRHFSEDFLLKYMLGKVPDDDILLQHASHIRSGEYSTLKLALEVKK